MNIICQPLYYQYILDQFHFFKITKDIQSNMRQVQLETLPKNSDLASCLQISSLKITPPKTPNFGQFSYPLPNIVSFIYFFKSTRVPVSVTWFFF